MELRHLRYYLAVAEEGTFRSAAEKLRVSQPALSKQVRDLEEELGVSLFARKASGVQLTAAGREFLAHAKQTLLSVEAAAKRAREADQGARGNLRVGIQGSLVAHFLPKALEPYRAANPDVDVVFREINSKEQFSALMSGEIDIGLGAVRKDAMPPWIGHAVIANLKLWFVMGAKHRLAGVPEISLAETVDERFLCFTEGGKSDDHAMLMREVFEAFGLRVPLFKRIGGPDAFFIQVVSANGVTLVPRLPSWTLGEGMAVAAIKESGPVMDLPVQAFWNEDSLEEAGKRFIETARKVLAEPERAERSEGGALS